MNKVELSAIERKILNCIQEDIPIKSQPFKILSNQVGIKEGEFLQRVKQLKSKGIIRRFAAGLAHRQLGFRSSLIALRVPTHRLNAIAQNVSQYPEITHCYSRCGKFNLWMVFLYKNGRLKTFLNRMAKQIGKENILNLPTKRQFKLKTDIKL